MTHFICILFKTSRCISDALLHRPISNFVFYWLNYCIISLVSVYYKDPKFWDARYLCCNLPKIQTKRSNLRIFCQNDADGIANSEDPDQTAPLGAVWSGSALFAQTCLSENLWSLRYKIEVLWLAPLAIQPDLLLVWLETQKTGFLLEPIYWSLSENQEVFICMWVVLTMGESHILRPSLCGPPPSLLSLRQAPPTSSRCDHHYWLPGLVYEDEEQGCNRMTRNITLAKLWKILWFLRL